MKAKFYRFATLFFISFLILSCAASEENIPLSGENSILSFSVIKGELSKQFDVSDNAISGSVNSNFELNDISLSVSVSKGATITPDPATIKSITAPFILTIKAANGDEKIYEVSINRIPSAENSILEFNINTPFLMNSVRIDEQNGLIIKRLPEIVDLKNLNVDLKHSKYATISPDPKTVKDYSSPVNFTVTSESGIEKIYQVKLEHMNIAKSESCSEANAWKWFGGDDRTNVPNVLPYDRNIGTGQEIVLNKDLVPSVFRVHLREGFRYFEANTDYNKAVTLKLIIRDGSKILASKTTGVPANFSGGFVSFDLERLNLLLEAGKSYVFYWYLVDGAHLGIVAGSSGSTNSGTGFCYGSGYTGESKISSNNTLEDLGVWYKHEWHFNVELEGKE